MELDGSGRTGRAEGTRPSRARERKWAALMANGRRPAAAGTIEKSSDKFATSLAPSCGCLRDKILHPAIETPPTIG